jgi:hypothetical protein
MRAAVVVPAPCDRAGAAEAIKNLAFSLLRSGIGYDFSANRIVDVSGELVNESLPPPARAPQSAAQLVQEVFC